MPTSQPTGPRHHGFHGREKELAWLRSHFDAVAARGADGKFAGPRMAFVVAESGIGKSRLVQELYIRLTNDPQWDPPEVNYWPDTFGDGGVNLAVAPNMHGHAAKGPPRFLWLGARWSDPDERNAVQSNVLPDLVRSLRRHAEIFDSYRMAWASLASRMTETVRREIGDEIAGEAVGRAMEAAVNQSFLAGLFVKIGASAVKFALDRHAGPQANETIEKRQEESLVEDLVDSFRIMLGSSDSVPAILWLDDAQWADQEARRFVAKLWEQALKRRWPLLIVLTHWEREWRELARAEGAGSPGDTLRDFVGQPGVEVESLENPSTAALRECLVSLMPQLIPEQQQLLIEKAGGNFLSLLENVGELLSEPMWFVEGALTGDAMAHIRTFETARDRRVEQRFRALDGEVKRMLGWSAEMGSRFLEDIVLDFAREKSICEAPQQSFERCLDPYALIVRAQSEVCEFRDPGYRRAATAYSARFLQRDRAEFMAFMRRRLVRSLESAVLVCELPQRNVFEPPGSSHRRERQFGERGAPRIASLQTFSSSSTWRSEFACVVVTESLRDALILAARHLRAAAEGGAEAEARTAVAARLWLLAEHGVHADARSQQWLALLESEEWSAELHDSTPPTLLWLWASAMPRSPRCAEAMCSAALKKWTRRGDDLQRQGIDANSLKDFLRELTDASRTNLGEFDGTVMREARVRLASLVVHLADRLPRDCAVESIRQGISHHAVILAESCRANAEGTSNRPASDWAASIYLPPESRDTWYDARWAVWLRLQIETASRAESSRLAERLREAINAQLEVPVARHDLNDLRALRLCVHDCQGSIGAIDWARAEYETAVFEWETSIEIEQASRAISIARLHEANGESQLARAWWDCAIAHWAAAAVEGCHWHSSEGIGFQAVTRDCCRHLSVDAAACDQSGVRGDCLRAIDALLKHAVSEAPPEWAKIIDYRSLAQVVALIAASLARQPLEGQAARELANMEMLDSVRARCEQARDRQQRSGHGPW